MDIFFAITIRLFLFTILFVSYTPQIIKTLNYLIIFSYSENISNPFTHNSSLLYIYFVFFFLFFVFSLFFNDHAFFRGPFAIFLSHMCTYMYRHGFFSLRLPFAFLGSDTMTLADVCCGYLSLWRTGTLAYESCDLRT